ncbi:rhodanese-related sulfurtransferase [Pseudobdellovibrio exovorus]|uniref:tRNA uridine(34) hydroxylase n=1 Tax=Pseudobdellovibrio exovorus JSS TaxID=1184267 RepID=M4VAI1_9BACT|nr:hypothetical protein A11Q_1249 [Pseudobdellovibrio exovorus JSS]
MSRDHDNTQSDSAEKAVYFISTFYKFQKDADPEKTKAYLEELAQKLDVRGLIIIGTEGFNATVCAKTPESMEDYKQGIRDYFKVPDLFFKDSVSDVRPFRRFRVKIRKEIVTLGDTSLVPYDMEGKNHHLSPTEWNQVMKNEDHVIIDTRNWYETKIGTFKGSLNPMTDKFTEFPEYLESKNIPKDKKILIFCTGGIRCEKGILEVQKQGYENVYQLYGGILNYLKEYPNDQFEGECFVFDHRVAVDQELQPSTQYKLCPHCGQPGKTEIDCKRCDTHALICEDCSEIPFKQDTCSKNCAHHYELHPERKAERQELPFESEEW